MCIIGPSPENILKVFVGDFERSWMMWHGRGKARWKRVVTLS